MSPQTEFDLTAGYNRIVDCWYPVFGPASHSVTPIAACAYPINMGERTIALIRDQVSPEDHHLVWKMQLMSMAVDKSDEAVARRGRYDLYCNWQGRAWRLGSDRLLFIENAVGWVDPVGVDDDAGLEVQISFGRPEFVDGIATMVVEFLVDESGAGDQVAGRCARRAFRIHADGRRDRLF